MDELEEAVKKWNRYFKSAEEIAEEEKYILWKKEFEQEVARLDLTIKNLEAQHGAYVSDKELKIQLAKKEIAKNGTPKVLKAILEFLGYK